MKTEVSLWELTYREFPVSLTGFGFVVLNLKWTLDQSRELLLCIRVYFLFLRYTSLPVSNCSANRNFELLIFQPITGSFEVVIVELSCDWFKY